MCKCTDGDGSNQQRGTGVPRSDPELTAPALSTSTEPSTSCDADGGIDVKGRRRQRSTTGLGRPRKPRTPSADVVAALVSTAKISQKLAECIVSARGATGISADPEELCQRVQLLQQLLGQQNANLALQRFPNLTTYSPATLALNYKQWQLFFGTQSTSALTSPVAVQLQQLRQQGLLKKLCSHPQLLCVDVERQVGNLYEIGALLQEQDLHEFAYKSLDLARTTPQVVQDKLLRVLTTLNSETDQQQQQQQPQQQQQQTQKQTAKQATSGLPAANDDAGQLPAEDIGEEPGSTDPTAADCASSSPASPTAAEAAGGRVFSMSEVAAAARLDRQWLLMAADSLESRLLGIRDELGLSLSQVGAMFLRTPSLLHKNPSTLAHKAAAFKALPGLNPQHAQEAISRMPSLLNLDPNRLKRRWQWLQEAADSHPTWRKQLDGIQPGTLASILIRSDTRYQRLQQVVAAGVQDKLALSSVLSASDKTFAERLAAGTQRTALVRLLSKLS